jgi:hypothetical protein
MSYSEWGYNIQTIEKDKIKEIAPKTFEKLEELIDSDWFTFAQSISSGEQNGHDSYIHNLISDLDLNIDIDFDEKFVEIENLWMDLVDEIKEQSSLDISIFAPTCDLGKCDISENDYYFTIENLYIINPNINKEIIDIIDTKNIVMGG